MEIKTMLISVMATIAVVALLVKAVKLIYEYDPFHE